MWNTNTLESTTLGLRHDDIKEMYALTRGSQLRERTRSLVMHRIIQIFSSPIRNYVFCLRVDPSSRKMPREIVTGRGPTSTCISSDPSLSTMITELCEGRWFAIRQTISRAFRYSISPGHRDLTGVGLRGCAFAIVSYRASRNDLERKFVFFFFFWFLKCMKASVCWDSRDYFLKVLRIILISIIHSYP